MIQKEAIKIFQEKEVRTIWDSDQEKWYFSIVDVVSVLTDSADGRKYWNKLKQRLKEEGNETVTNCHQLKMRAADGKMRMTDVADTGQLFRLIQSIPSPKAEPFKLWMAQVALERLDEMQDPELTIDRAMMEYKRLGYSDKADEKWELAQMTGQERLTYLDFCEAGSYMDFLLPILPQTGIAVKTLRTEDLAVEELREQLRMGDRREQLRLIACGETTLTGDPEENERKLMYLRERFAYQYPHPGLQKLYTKTTVSELKIAAMAEKDEAAFHTFEEKEVVPYIPGFRREQEKVSGAVRGNAFHRVMELLDFMYVFVESGLFEKCPGDYETYRKRLDAERLKNRLEEFLQRETISLRLTEEYAKAVSLPKILNFLEQELAYRMWRAQEQGLLYREQPFVLGIDAKRLDPDLPEGEKVLIQGIIDVFFIEDGEIVLLDYKTDVIDSLEALWNRYNVQIQYYEEALTKLMQMPVKERILYSFYLEKYK